MKRFKKKPTNKVPTMYGQTIFVAPLRKEQRPERENPKWFGALFLKIFRCALPTRNQTFKKFFDQPCHNMHDAA